MGKRETLTIKSKDRLTLLLESRCSGVGYGWSLGIFRVPCGFTLLEVMVAMAIIAVTLTAVLGSQSQSLSLANEAKFNTTAPLLAQSKMAEIALKNPEELATDSGDFGENFPDYKWELEVGEVVLEGLEKASERVRQVDLKVLAGLSGRYVYHLRVYVFLSKGV